MNQDVVEDLASHRLPSAFKIQRTTPSQTGGGRGVDGVRNEHGCGQGGPSVHVKSHKGKLGIVFLSDMTTADGKHLEVFALDPKEQDDPQGKFTFPRENPTNQNWEVWKFFWRQHTVKNFQLHTPLGA